MQTGVGGMSLLCRFRTGVSVFSGIFLAACFSQAGVSGPFTYQAYGSYVEIVDCDTTVEVAHIPEHIEGLPVTGIQTEAFKNCASLNGILIPASVSVIESDAFKNCSALVRAVYQGAIPTLGTNAFNNIHSDFAHYTKEPAPANGHPIIYYEGCDNGFVVGNHEILTYIGWGGTSNP
jgi:hypothetical protein